MTNYQVETHDRAIRDALLKIGADNGWTGFASVGQCENWLTISEISPKGGHNNREISDYQTVAIPDFIALLKKRPTIYIEKCEVSFLPNGDIQVGSHFVPEQIVDAIHARLHANSKAET